MKNRRAKISYCWEVCSFFCHQPMVSLKSELSLDPSGSKVRCIKAIGRGNMIDKYRGFLSTLHLGWINYCIFQDAHSMLNTKWKWDKIKSLVVGAATQILPSEVCSRSLQPQSMSQHSIVEEKLSFAVFLSFFLFTKKDSTRTQLFPLSSSFRLCFWNLEQ